MDNKILNDSEKLQIEASIKEAEKLTSGEIRVHIEDTCSGNVLDRAAGVFSSLNMHKTKLRNGVLFYLAIRDHKFAVLGDSGINALVPGNFWDDIKIKMQIKFRQGRYAEGLSEGIKLAGAQLQAHFPLEAGDENELSDKISFGAI